jgi:hypothetical protein
MSSIGCSFFLICHPEHDEKIILHVIQDKKSIPNLRLKQNSPAVGQDCFY